MPTTAPLWGVEHLLEPILEGKHVIVEGRLAGTARTALERPGAEVEELRLGDEKRYMDMTPAIFVLDAVNHLFANPVTGISELAEVLNVSFETAHKLVLELRAS